jgi:predicted TIM-barrel enzyme
MVRFCQIEQRRYYGRPKRQMNRDFLSLFERPKPVLGMLHLIGESDKDVLRRAWGEADIMTTNGVDAVIVENYYGTPDHVRLVLEEFSRQRVPFLYGVNLLDDDEANFQTAARYGAAFLQLDSVAGHLSPADDAAFGVKMDEWRASYGGCVIGGVRFKYQPYLSGRTLEEDLHIGMDRCDAIAVTGPGTGMETEVSKIRAFRQIVGAFPLIAAAGVTPENCAAQLEYADGCIVGSYFKDKGEAAGELNAGRVRALMSAVQAVREGHSMQ